MDFLIWLGVLVLLVFIGFLLDREIYFYEGTHLGRRVQAWLYDRWAKQYDAGKRESQLQDDAMLAQPLSKALQNIPEPFVLDFATGTGRLSFALIMNRPEFNGHIIALDLSQGMLEQAATKLAGLDTPEQHGLPNPRLNANVEFLRHQTLPLPFPDAAFDVVCALEVLELFPDMDEPLAEFSRVLRPGGVFLTSRGTEESGRKAKVKSVTEFSTLLEKNGFEDIHIAKWWKFFDRVLAVKPGTSKPLEKRNLQGILQCSDCGQTQWKRMPDSLKCGNCGKELLVTREGIVLN